MNPAVLVAVGLAALLAYARMQGVQAGEQAAAAGVPAAMQQSAGATGQGSPGLDFLGTGPFSGGLISGSSPPATASAGYSNWTQPKYSSSTLAGGGISGGSGGSIGSSYAEVISGGQTNASLPVEQQIPGVSPGAYVIGGPAQVAPPVPFGGSTAAAGGLPRISGPRYV